MLAYIVKAPVNARFPSSISAPSSNFLSLIPAIVTQSDTASEGAVIAPDALIAAVFSTEENVFSPVIVCLVANVTKVLSTYFLSAFVSSISARLSVSAIPDRKASNSFHLFMMLSVSEPSKKSLSLLETEFNASVVAYPASALVRCDLLICCDVSPANAAHIADSSNDPPVPPITSIFPVVGFFQIVLLSNGIPSNMEGTTTSSVAYTVIPPTETIDFFAYR